MKKFFSIVALALLAFACGPVPNEVESNVGITAPDGFSVACASGFTRVVPHFCMYTPSTPLVTGLTSDNTCRSVDINGNYGVPTTATYVVLSISTTVTAQNSTATRTNTLDMYTENTCVTRAYPNQLTVITYEETAKAANPILLFKTTPYIIKLGVNATYYYKGVVAGTNSAWSIFVSGYYD